MNERAILTFGMHPLSPFTTLARDLNNALERETYPNTHRAQILENEEAFFVSMDIPGVNFDDINIDLEENKLTVSAERKNPFDKTGESIKKYNQVFTLPKNIEDDKISAHYENGVLGLTFPKMNVQKKKIQVTSGQKSKHWTNLLGFKKNETESLVN